MERALRRRVGTRIMVVVGLLLGAEGLIVTRLFWLQVLSHTTLASRAASQVTEEVQFTPKRGAISDRAGRRLAVDVEVDSVFAVPSRVQDKPGVARALAALTGRSPEVYLRELGKRRSFVWLQRRVSPAVVAELTARGLEGIDFRKENRRFYPQREFGAHVLGVAGIDNQGLAGVEQHFDAQLWRDAVWFVSERDALGRDILISGPPQETLREADEVRLTLDETVQFIAQEELERGVQGAQAKGGMIVVLDPRTGEVLAMANTPSFNPNEFQSYPAEQMRNRSVADALEPGSIMKTFLLSAALEEGVVTLETAFDCENGAYQVGGRTLHDVHPYGVLDVAGVIAKSSNIGSTKIAMRLGAEKYHRYLRSFGFGERTGVDLPGEAAGMLRPVRQWSGTSIASVAIGQEVSVTAVQMAAAFAAAVNGGSLLRPHVLHSVRSPEGEVVRERGTEKVRQVISAVTSRRVRTALERVVTDGTGKSAALDGYTVAGKTGTAQKFDTALRAYSPDRYLASFVGCVPSAEPRLVILVMVDEPRGQIYGGSVAAPVFRQVAARALRYLNVPPETPERLMLVRS